MLDNLDELVVKAVNESGGYGMLVGPHSTAESRAEFAGASRPTRATTSPSRRCRSPGSPLLLDGHFEGRHVDLRPYILYGEDIYVLPGGLTRVALTQGLAGRELLSGRRQQGHLGADRVGMQASGGGSKGNDRPC